MPQITPGFVLDFVQSALLVVLALVQWLRKPGEDAGKAVKSHADAMAVELSRINVRVQHVEDRMQHMPTDEELAQLSGDVQTVKAVVEGQRDLLKRVEHQQTLILEQLLSRTK